MTLQEILTNQPLITTIQPLKVTQPTTIEIVSAADSIDYIISKYGDMSAAKSNYFISQYNFYLKIKQDDINRAYMALTADYNTLDNNDVVTESVTLNKSDKMTVSPSATKTVDYAKSYDAGIEQTGYTENIIMSGAESTPSNTLTETFQDNDNAGYNATSKTLERKHGNISSITNQSIIKQEIENRLQLSMLDFIDKAVMHGGVYYDN